MSAGSAVCVWRVRGGCGVRDVYEELEVCSVGSGDECGVCPLCAWIPALPFSVTYQRVHFHPPKFPVLIRSLILFAIV